MKVKEVSSYVKPMLSMDYVKKAIQRGLDNYNAKYIQTDSIDPLYHVCFGGMIFSYLVALPNERRHLEHQQHAKEHGHHWSHPGTPIFIFFWIFESFIGLGILLDGWLIGFCFYFVFDRYRVHVSLLKYG